MDLNELQSVRDRERQTDKLQQLRESFYGDAGGFIQQLRAERDRAVERADDPFDSPEVRQLSDEIKTAQQTVEAIYEKRVGKIVKAASFAAADLPAEVDGMTAEEQALFDNLVGNIKDNREDVLALLDGDESGGQATSSGPTETAPVETETEPATPAEIPPESPAQHDQTAGDPVQTQTDPGRQPQTDPDTHPQTKNAQQSSDTSRVAAGSDQTSGQQSGHGDTNGNDADSVSAADVMGSGPDNQSDNYASTGQSPTDPVESSTEQPTPTNSGSSGVDSLEHNESEAAQSAGKVESAPPQSEPVDPPVRKDGGQQTTAARQTGQETTPPGHGTQQPTPTETSEQTPASGQDSLDSVERQRVQILDDVETFLGFDDRDYDLEPDDVVSLPATNADILLERGVAREL